MDSAIEKLRNVAALILEHGDSELAAWLSAGVDAFLSGEPLGGALGLTGTARQAWLHGKRNGLVRAAGQLIGGNNTWSIAMDLAKEARTFNRVWPRLKKIDRRKRPAANRLREIFCEAADLGLPIPDTAERLYQILQADDRATKSCACSTLVDQGGG